MLGPTVAKTMVSPESNPPNETLTDLVNQVRAGRSLALDRLLLRMHGRLAARVERRLPADVRPVCSPEDILQETYEDAFGSVGQFVVRDGQDPGEAFFRWLAAIADHRVVDAVRHLRAAKRGGGGMTAGGAGPVGAAALASSSLAPIIELLAIDSHTPSRDARAHELEDALRLAIRGLYPAYREALELRYLLGLSPAEVATRLGRTEPAVHKLCGRALGALRESLAASGVVPPPT